MTALQVWRKRRRRFGRSRAGFVIVLLGAAACTPLGGWLYDDPTFVLSEVEYRQGGAVGDTLALVLTGCNRNDFSVIGTEIELSMEVAGNPPQHAEIRELFTLNQRDSARLVVPLNWSGQGADQAPIDIALTGHTLLKTPLGDRRVAFAQRGRVGFQARDRGQVLPAGRPCRPGLSTLPATYTTPIYINPPEPTRPGAPVGIPQ